MAIDEDDEQEQLELQQAQKKTPEGVMPSLPIVLYYHKMYAVSLGENDQKAVHVFKNYEPQEKLRRLQSELVAVKNGKASEKACEIAIGKKRIAKYQSYDNWAKLMLLWLSQSKPS